MATELSHLVVDANEVLELKLVRSLDDIEDDESSFGPEMSHQVFGENENIFGYADLHIRLYYTAGSLLTYLDIDYSAKIDPAEYAGVRADDVEKKITEVLAPNYIKNIDDFVRCIDKDNKFKPYGKLVHTFNVQQLDGSQSRQFEIYYCEISTPGFLEYHKRLQTFLLWYIDAASFIDTDDDQWTFFVVFEKYKCSEGDMRYATVGYATVYKYYAYPTHIRPRISQVLVLPPFQKMGVCANLVQAIYNKYASMSEVVDITVEDPSPEFQRIRDFVDAKNLMKLPAFQPDKLKEGFSKEMCVEAMKSHRVCSKQARRVFEILSLMNTNVNDPSDYKRYRLMVKNRLNAPHQKKKLDLKKLQKVLSAEEYAASVSSLGLEETQNRLNVQYKALHDEYRKVIERIEDS